jgi:hypothetical protein
MKTRQLPSKHQLINGDQAGQRQHGSGTCAINEARAGELEQCSGKVRVAPVLALG